jgi:hypothetical protein
VIVAVVAVVAVETVTLRMETTRRMETRKRRRNRRKKGRRATTLSRLCQQAHPMFPTAFHAQRGDMKMQ